MSRVGHAPLEVPHLLHMTDDARTGFVYVSPDKRLDEEVLKSELVAGVSSMQEVPVAAALLVAIALHSDHRLDSKYTDFIACITAVRTIEGLHYELQKAWGVKNFQKIREMKELQVPHRTKGDIFLSEIDETDGVLKAWRIKYAGESDRILHKTINTMHETRQVDDAYRNFVSIVQSSGFGKSRTVDELAKSVFTLPFNLRASEEGGYPYADVAVREFLAVRPAETVPALRMRYLSFLVSLFETVLDELKGTPVQSNSKALALFWRNTLEEKGFRAQFYKKVVDVDSLRYLTIDDASAAVAESIATLCSRVADLSGRPHTTKEVEVVIYIDESHDLTKWFAVEDDTSSVEFRRSAYQTLCWAFNYILQSPVFVIYLSTNSALSSFAPPPYRFSSDRYTYTKYPLQAPFIELPFDNWHNGILVKENMHTVNSICQDQFMVRFGRPLFWTRYETGNAAVKKTIVQFAIEKLTRRSAHDSIVESDATLATLGIRLLLEFEPGRFEAAQIENRLVAGHMRVVYSVPEHLEYLRAGAPSEPIMAEAAARVMANISVLRILSNFLDRGLISEGERGELVARLLLTLAHDRAVRAMAEAEMPQKRKESSLPQADNIRYSRPIPLIDFLGALVAPDHLQKILQCRPDNDPSGLTLQEAFKDAVVHFTHFAKAGDDSVVSDAAAWKAMCRGIIWQCFDRQEAIDILGPILLNSKAKLGRYNMSGMFVQIKNRAAMEPIYIDAEKLGYFSQNPDEDPLRPYLVLEMELGVQSSPPLLDIADPRTGMETRSKNHPRYTINIRGCSSKVYGVITEDETDTYARLLATRSLLEEHPRQDPDCVDAIRRLKPMWWYGTSFNWTNVEDSTTKVHIPDFEEGVTVGSFVLNADASEDVTME